MNPKDRVRRSIERRKIDRVPLALHCGGPGSAYEKLRQHFSAQSGEEILQKMEIDIRGVFPRYVGPSERSTVFEDGVGHGLTTEFGGTEYMKCDYSGSDGIAGTYSDDLGNRPLKDCTSVSEIENYQWPQIEWFDFGNIREDCIKHKQYAIVLGGWAPLLSRLFELFGMKTTLVNIKLRPNMLHAAIRKITDFYCDFYDTALSYADGMVDIVGWGDDFATQDNLMISPESWRSFFKQPLVRLFSLGRKHGVYTFFHACGAIRSIIPDLVEAKLDILFPVQPRAKGMDHGEIKEEFGDHLAFWGGIDVQKTLPFGTPRDVRQEVRERIRVLGRGGGYILSSSHNILQHVPLENILAMYEEAVKTKPKYN